MPIKLSLDSQQILCTRQRVAQDVAHGPEKTAVKPPASKALSKGNLLLISCVVTEVCFNVLLVAKSLIVAEKVRSSFTKSQLGAGPTHQCF